MSKKFWLVGLLVLIISLSPGVVGSAKSAATQTIVWKFQSVLVKGASWTTIIEENAFREIEKRTNGGLKIELYGSGGLGIAGSAILDAVSTGVLEAAEMWGGHVMGTWPIASMAEYPGVLPFDVKMKQAVAKALFPYWEKSLIGRNVVLWYADFVEPRNIFTKKKAETMAGFKGMKIRAAGVADVIQALGVDATAVPTEYNEVYTALERGILDGHITTNTATLSARLHEQEKYMYETNLGGFHGYFIINKRAWEALPAEYQKVVREVADDFIAVRWREDMTKSIDQARKDILGAGLVYMNAQNPKLLDEMRSGIVRSCNPELEKMVKKAGPVGTEMLTVIRDVVKKHGYQWAPKIP